MQAKNLSRGLLVSPKVEVANTSVARARGLLGRDAMSEGESLWIVPCSMIHTFFMQFPIDVVFLDKRLEVVRVIERLRPWRMSPWILRSHSVLELPAGALRGSVRVGERLEIQ